MDKIERIAILYLSFLNSPGGLSFARIRESLPAAYEGDPESARRKFERDKDELRSLGLDLRHFAPGARLPDGSAARDHVYAPAEELQKLPEIRLSREDLELLAATLLGAVAELDQENSEERQREQALLRSAAAKLLYRNPAQLYETRQAPAAFFTPESEAATESLALAHDALTQRRVLSFQYQDRTGRREERRVAARGLISHHLRWVLVARCFRADAIRSFYIDRMSELKLHDEKFAPDPRFRIKDYSLHPLAVHAGPEAELIVDVNPDRLESLEDFLSGLPPAREPERRGEQRLVLRTTNPGAFFSWMLRNPGAIDALGPPSMHAAFIERLEAIKALHDGEPA